MIRISSTGLNSHGLISIVLVNDVHVLAALTEEPNLSDQLTLVDSRVFKLKFMEVTSHQITRGRMG
jgi:hypothetical protein